MADEVLCARLRRAGPALALVLGLMVSQAACSCSRHRDRSGRTIELEERAEQALLQGDYETAAETLRQALRTKPRDKATRARLEDELGLALWHHYLATRDESFLQEAEEMLKAACRDRPDWKVCWVNLGNLHWFAGRTARAAKAYERALALDPQHPDAALLRARIRRARVESEAVGEVGRDGGLPDASAPQTPSRRPGRASGSAPSQPREAEPEEGGAPETKGSEAATEEARDEEEERK